MANQSKHSKWKFAIGTTSRVPQDSGGLHYLIADFDSPIILSPELLSVTRSCRSILQQTTHGWHLYTNLKMEFNKLTEVLPIIGADPAWIEIGKKRGYYFLADKDEIYFPWPVEHMVIHHGKKTSQNS